uniref:Reverse transcriptase n=1 Tax=Rhizoctonia solani TaxID=456999 RepID=Q9P315_9AGAM|nr:reverse transcriptase [Rhizoctonia solani]
MKKLLRQIQHNLLPQLAVGDTVDKLHKGSSELIGGNLGSIRASLRQLQNEGKFRSKTLYLPNISKFKIGLGEVNPLLYAGGIFTRYGSKRVMTIGPNSRANRYLAYMYKRMYQLDENKRRLCLSKVLSSFIRRSNSYLIAVLFSIDKNLYRERSMKFTLDLIKSINYLRGYDVSFKVVNRLQATGDLYNVMFHMIDYYRAYIPKPGTNKVRPLGVPTLPWRIYMKMFLIPLQLQLDSGSFQHGFVPRRGTLTCWNAMSNTVLKSKNILEVDFKGFFPSVSAINLTVILGELGILPGPLIRFLHSMNESKPFFRFWRPLQREVILTTMRMYSIMEEIVKYFERRHAGLLERFYQFHSEFGKTAIWARPQEPKYWFEKIFSESFFIAHGWINLPSMGEKLRFLRDPSSLYKKYPHYNIFVSLRESAYGLFNRIAELHGSTISEENFSGAQSFMAQGSNKHSLPQFEREDESGTESGFLVSPIENREPTSDPHLFPFRPFGKLKWKNPFKFKISQFGLPQGGPLSPFLSTIVLKYFVNRLKRNHPEIECLFYADDGFFYSSNTEAFNSFLSQVDTLLKEVGIQISFEKSLLRRYDGVCGQEIKGETWTSDMNTLRPIEGFSPSKSVWMKFLGLEYNWENGMLRSNTRQGRSLTYTHKDMLIFSQVINDALKDNFLASISRNPKFPLIETLSLLYFLHKQLLDPNKVKVQALINRFSFSFTKNQEKFLKRFLTLSNKSLLRMANSNLQVGLPKFLKSLKNHPVLLTSLGQLEKPLQEFFPSPFGGLVQARLYYGSNIIKGFDTDTGSQNFNFKVSPNSVGSHLKSRNSRLTTFVGSSYGASHLLKMASSLRAPNNTPVWNSIPLKEDIIPNVFTYIPIMRQVSETLQGMRR